MVVATRFWQDPSALKDIYVSATGGVVNGSQLTNAVAGTVTFSSGAGQGRRVRSGQRELGRRGHGAQCEHERDRDHRPRGRVDWPVREHAL